MSRHWRQLNCEHNRIMFVLPCLKLIYHFSLIVGTFSRLSINLTNRHTGNNWKPSQRFIRKKEAADWKGCHISHVLSRMRKMCFHVVPWLCQEQYHFGWKLLTVTYIKRILQSHRSLLTLCSLCFSFFSSQMSLYKWQRGWMTLNQWSYWRYPLVFLLHL